MHWAVQWSAENSGIILFVDEAQLTDKSWLALQLNLDVSSTRATETEMMLNVRKYSTRQPDVDKVPLETGSELIQIVES